MPALPGNDALSYRQRVFAGYGAQCGRGRDLPSHYEPLLVGGEPLFADIIEDELLLALPMWHAPSEECSVRISSDRQAGKTNTDTGATAKENPFAVLADLKKD